MITTSVNLRRSGSRQPRPPRLRMPRSSARGRRTVSSASRVFLFPHSTRQVRTSSFSADLLTALATVAGIFLWGGLLVLLGG